MEPASILVVEDEAIVALDLRMQLQDMGYDVVGTAETAQEAIGLAKRHRPTLVLMDVQLKGEMDGVEAADVLRRTLEMPVIFLTSFSDSVTVSRAARTAPYGYLTKPFQIKELRAGIEIALCKAQMERQSRESERWFASTLRCVQDGVIVTERDGRIRFINPAAENLLGSHVDEVRGRHVADVVRFGDFASQECTLVRALRDARICGVVHSRELLTAEGGRIQVDESAGPILDEDGTPIGGVMILRNATDRVRQEQRLKASEERFRSAFSNAPLGMALLSMDGAFLQVNDALCRLLGCNESWLRLQEHLSLTCPDDVEHEQARLRGLLEGAPVVQFEKRYLHSRDARPISTLVSASLMREGDEAVCYLYQIHDLTEQKKAAEDLARFAEERMIHQATQIASSAKSEFLARMSHEMRTPLNAVIGFAQLLQIHGDVGRNNAPKYSEHILNAGQHLLSLVDDVLDLQKISSGHMELNLESLELDDCVEEARSMLCPSADKAGIALVADVPPGVKICGDAKRMKQVLLNLGSNAIKYNNPHGQVTWTMRKLDNGRIRLTVGDTGAGMSAQQMARLFEPFERLGKETSAIPGTGLGLVITRRLVQEMGGDLSIDSEPGIGTQVHVDLLAS